MAQRIGHARDSRRLQVAHAKEGAVLEVQGASRGAARRDVEGFRHGQARYGIEEGATLKQVEPVRARRFADDELMGSRLGVSQDDAVAEDVARVAVSRPAGIEQDFRVGR